MPQFNVVVTNSSGQPVPNARVCVLTDALSGRTRHTDGGGFANFFSGPPIPPQVFDVIIDAAGYAPYCTDANQGTSITFGPTDVTLNAQLSFRRPVAKRHSALPAFDQSDSGGIVHTTPPPELSIPTGRDLMFMRGDFNGVEIDLGRWGFPTPPAGQTLFNVAGANSTPPGMIMTPMLPLYPRKLQDAVLTEHAERGYWHMIVASDGWNFTTNQFSWSPQQFTNWCNYVKSWGFYVVYWSSAQIQNPYLSVARNTIDWHVCGEEVDTKMTAEQYEAVLDDNLQLFGGPTGAHFTDNYPEGFPRDTFLTNWSKYNGRVHLMWQANQNDSAGTQGARLYYARQRVNLGTVGGDGNPAPDSRVYAFETMATKQLYGQCTEEYGNLRSLELLYTTRDNLAIRAMAGFGNGCRLPSGDPI